MALTAETKNRLKSVFRTPETGDEVVAAIEEAAAIGTSEITNGAVTLAKLASNVVPTAPFTASTLSDWDTAPTTIQEALDQLAARIKALEP